MAHTLLGKSSVPIHRMLAIDLILPSPPAPSPVRGRGEQDLWKLPLALDGRGAFRRSGRGEGTRSRRGEGANTMTDTIHITMLGALEIRRGAAVLDGWASRKVQALLCYLALSERALSRATLMELLWGDMPDHAAQTNLRKALSNLGQMVGAAAVIKRDVVTLDRALVLVDVWRFEQLCTVPDADLAQLQAAVDGYGGDFLAGFALRDAPTFDEWASTQREYLRGLLENTLYTLGLRYSAAGEADLAKSIGFMTRLLHLDPYREEAYRHLMHILARTGQRAAALNQYEICQQRLAADLGVEPTPETQALYARIKGAETPRQNPLPPEGSAFIGRDAEVTTIITTLQTATCRLLTVVGAGGMGKTRLALHVAHALPNHFWNGVWFVSLAALAAPSAADGVQAVSVALADALALVLDGATPAHQQLFDYLRTKEMLLVLDNFEHLLTASAVIEGILHHAPQVKLLVTSRERLHLYEEHALEIAGLRLPPAELAPTENPESYSAVRLFCAQARRSQLDWQPQPADHAAIGQICRLLEGMPLGLELAASWVRVMSCAEIATQIVASVDFLSSSVRNLPLRHRSLRAVFDHSWQLLTTDERLVLAQSAVFQGPFSLHAALHCTTASISTVTALVDKSLLRSTAASQYLLPETVRQFALEQLTALGQVAAFQARHATYYGALVARRAPDLVGGEQLAALQEIGAAWDNIRLAWDWALAHGDFTAIGHAADGVFRFLDIRSRFQEGETRLRQALTAMPDAPTDRDQAIVRATIVARRGWFLAHLGQPDQSQAALQTSLAELGAWNAEPETLFNLNYLAAVLRHRGGYTQAKHYAERGLHLAERLNDRWSASVALNILGQVASLEGDYALARGLSSRSLQIKREINDRWGMAFSLLYLGRIEHAAANYVAAEALFRESMTISTTFGDQRGVAFALQNIGDTAYAKGAYAQAATVYAESVQMYATIGVRQDTSLVWTKCGEAAAAQDDWDTANTAFKNALHIALAIDSTPAMLSGLIALIGLRAQLAPSPQIVAILDALSNHPDLHVLSQRQIAALHTANTTIERDQFAPTAAPQTPPTLQTLTTTALQWV